MRTPERHPSQTIYWVIEPTLWSSIDNVRAQREGWMLSHLGEIFKCHVHNHGLKPAWDFSNDQEAATYVQQRADEGSEFHIRAMVACTAARLHPPDGITSWGDGQ